MSYSEIQSAFGSALQNHKIRVDVSRSVRVLRARGALVSHVFPALQPRTPALGHRVLHLQHRLSRSRTHPARPSRRDHASPSAASRTLRAWCTETFNTPRRRLHQSRGGTRRRCRTVRVHPDRLISIDRFRALVHKPPGRLVSEKQYARSHSVIGRFICVLQTYFHRKSTNAGFNHKPVRRLPSSEAATEVANSKTSMGSNGRDRSVTQSQPVASS